MNRSWKPNLGVALAALWVCLIGGALPTAALGLDGQVRRFTDATLEKRVKEEVLVFVADRDGRSFEIKGLLSDRTTVLDEENRRIRDLDDGPGSIWTIALEYPEGREGTPTIVKMRRIRSRLPE